MVCEESCRWHKEFQDSRGRQRRTFPRKERVDRDSEEIFRQNEMEHSRHHWDTWFSQGYDKHSGSNKVKQSGRWTWLNWFVPAVISIVGMWVSYGIVSKEWCVKRVADGIKSSKIPEVDKEEPFLERKELIETLTKYFDRMKWNTVVITGPRGSGKSTAVRMALQNKPSVVAASFSSGDFTAPLITKIGVTNIPENTSSLRVFEAAVKSLAQKRPLVIVPTVVVEVDSKCTPQDLQELLLDLKNWSHDCKYAKFVVVMSQSRTLYGLNIGLSELRCSCYIVDDLGEGEAEEFLKESFSLILEIPEMNVDDLVNSTLPKVGCRLLHLHELTKELDIFRPNTVEKLKKVLDNFVQRKIRQSAIAITSFVESAKVDRRKAANVFKKAMDKKTTLILSEACTEMGITIQDYYGIKNIYPYLFNVDPMESTISVSSQFMFQATSVFVANEEKRRADEQDAKRKKGWFF